MKKNEGGYIAFVTVLLITAIVVVIGTATSLLSINDLLSSYAGFKNEESLDLVESCVEDVLIRLNENGAIPGTVTIGTNTCTVSTNSQVGSTWDFTVTSPASAEYVKRIRVVASRTTTVAVTSWLEQ